MPTKIQLSVLVAFAAVLWFVALLLGGADVSIALLKPYTLVVSALGGLLICFDRWLWRSRVLAGWLIHRPDIAGTWLAALSPTGESHNEFQTMAAYIAVRQTYSSLSMRLYSEESSSELLSGQISRAQDGTFRIAAVYRNTPRISLQDISRTHHGAMLMSISTGDQVTLSGHYWTDRLSVGEIQLTERRRKIADSHASARALFAA